MHALQNLSDWSSGTTAQEVDLDPAPGDAIRSWTDEDLVNYVSRRLDKFDADDPGLANRSLVAYTHSSRDAEHAFTTMTTDVRVTCGNNRLAALAAQTLRSPVYRYGVTSTPSRGAHALNTEFAAKYAFHGWDVYAFFGTYDMIMSDHSESDERFSATLQDNFLFFGKSGKPRDPKWLPYPEKVALIGERLQINSTYNSQQCSNLWRGYFKYSWTN